LLHHVQAEVAEMHLSPPPPPPLPGRQGRGETGRVGAQNLGGGVGNKTGREVGSRQVWQGQGIGSSPMLQTSTAQVKALKQRSHRSAGAGAVVEQAEVPPPIRP